MTRTRKWSLVSALLVVVILLAGWFLLVAPKRTSADDLRAQAAAQQVRNDGLKAQIAQLQAQQKGLPQQQAVIADVQQRLPQNPELPALIRSLSSMAAAAGVDVHTLTPVAPLASAAQPPAGAVGAAGQTLQVIAINMEVDGTYFNVERFLNKMESLKRALLVTGITLNVNATQAAPGAPAPVVQAGASPNLAAIINFRAFMISSLQAPGTSPLHVTAPSTSVGGTTGTTSTTSTPTQ